jgi:hypothetical protein
MVETVRLILLLEILLFNVNINLMAGILSRTRPFLSGFTKRKKITIDAAESIRNHIVDLTIYNTAGTDTVSAIYLDGNVRSDWGDVRFTKEDGTTCLPFAILRTESTYIEIQFQIPVGRTSTVKVYLYYDGPAADVFKIASITDSHYDAGSDVNDRDLTLMFIANFVTRMQTYLPDLAVNNGDKTGASSAVEATQLSWYQSVLDAFDNVDPYCTDWKDGVAPGNHDFEYMSFANVLAKHSAETWMETGVMYGDWETTNFHFISLDANYTPNTDTHLTISHQGYGYINPAQIAWLKTTLAAATKDVIVFCHQPLCELDTEQWTLTKDIYHTQNRADIRNILEASGKVVACIHGHTHFSRIDVIEGIPYICTGNLTNDAVNNANLAFGELPAVSEGRWELIEFDRSSRTIRVKHEVLISAAYHTVYDSIVPFGITSISNDISNNPEAVYSSNYNAAFDKSNYLRDACQLYVIDDDYLRKFPVNFHTPDDPTQKNYIRIQGRTNAPNYGRAYWVFDAPPGKFCFEGTIYLTTLSGISIKLGKSNVSTAPGVDLFFTTGGDIKVYHGLVETLLTTYSADTEYKFQIFVDTVNGDFSLIINGVSYNNAGAGYDFYITPYPIRQLEIVTETGDFFIHNFRIRPWTVPFDDNPEIITVGAEETP